MPKQRVHFIGIGGIGTSALARWFLSEGWKVSGSDIASSSITEKLKKEGVRVFISHKVKNVPADAKLAVYSAALPSDNPEIKKTRELGIPIKSYAQTIGDLTKNYKTIAIAGAHGKSTSTALLSLILIKAGFDPTVFIGTNLKEFGNRNFRKGKSRYLVLEADEYQKSFLNYSPFAVMITNIDREHLDFYKNLGEIKNVFLKFIASIKSGGILVVNRDDKNLLSLKDKIQKIAQKNKIKLSWYGIRVNPRNYLRLSALLKISGEHNISNAMGVYTLAKALSVKESPILKALASYRGAWRRMEFRGKLEVASSKYQVSSKKVKKSLIHATSYKIPVYDDYAHHPTEIKATLSGIAQKWPKSALICVFQPHQAKRLQALFREFTGAFDAADALILLDIYKVPGRDSQNADQRRLNADLRGSKPSRNINSQKLAEAIREKTKELKTNKLKTIVYLPHSSNIAKRLKLTIATLMNSIRARLPAPEAAGFGGQVNPRSYPRKSALVIMMGAGDIVNYTDLLL